MPTRQASLIGAEKYIAGTGVTSPPLPPSPPLSGAPNASVPLPWNWVFTSIAVTSAWNTIPFRSDIAAGLLTTTEASLPAVSTPAKARPNALALFSLIWKPDADASVLTSAPATATVSAARTRPRARRRNIEVVLMKHSPSGVECVRLWLLATGFIRLFELPGATVNGTRAECKSLQAGQVSGLIPITCARHSLAGFIERTGSAFGISPAAINATLPFARAGLAYK